MLHADGIFLVYDISNRDTFDKVDEWSRAIHEATSNIELLLLGNKCDLDDSERVVSYEEGQEKAKELGCEFFETSAKDGTNVKEAFERLVNILANSTKLKGKEGVGLEEGKGGKKKKKCC